jgi:TonB family protein
MLCALVAATSTAAVASSLKKCHPMPKLLHYETVADNRESRIPPSGQVVVEFTVALNGNVSDPIVVKSYAVPEKGWYDSVVLESIVKWKYAPIADPCRGRTTFKFKRND